MKLYGPETQEHKKIKYELTNISEGNENIAVISVPKDNFNKLINGIKEDGCKMTKPKQIGNVLVSKIHFKLFGWNKVTVCFILI